MFDLTVIILTYNEEKHIQRCIQNIKLLTENIFVVDSNSNDNTVKMSKTLGAKIFNNKWEYNHAKQFNWALNNLPIETEWVLRLDADEYLLPELIEEIKKKLSLLGNNVNGIIFKRQHIFLNKWMKRGIYPVKLIRLFRYKKAICEQRWMDEHITLIEGDAIEFGNDFVDHNLNNLTWWINKHNGYATREAFDLLNIKNNNVKSGLNVKQSSNKRWIKENIYSRLPLFIRPFFYFIYRYFFRLGFLDGVQGLIWTFSRDSGIVFLLTQKYMILKEEQKLKTKPFQR